jgi:hypothetical protein
VQAAVFGEPGIDGLGKTDALQATHLQRALLQYRSTMYDSGCISVAGLGAPAVFRILLEVST